MWLLIEREDARIEVHCGATSACRLSCERLPCAVRVSREMTLAYSECGVCVNVFLTCTPPLSSGLQFVSVE